MTSCQFRFLGASISLTFFAFAATAQPSRISRTADGSERTLLMGHIPPKARPENDRGRVSPSKQLTYVTLMLSQSESQQADLDQLLEEQQNPDSPNYHKWLTPEEYAQRFGASQEDIDKITAWLESQGLANSTRKFTSTLRMGKSISPIPSSLRCRPPSLVSCD